MNIAELFVRVTGDTSDVERKMRGASQAVDSFGNSTNRAARAQEGHRLSLGRVERALSSYVGHAVGANAVTEQLSVAFGAFATGGEVMAGVLLGLGALAAAYELITADSRKAREESDKLTKSLLDQAAAQFQATEAGARAIAQSREQNLADIQRESSFGIKSGILSILSGKPTLDPADAAAHANRVADAQEAVNQAWANAGKIALDTAAKTNVASTATKEMTFRFNELRDAAAKVNAEIQSEGKDFWRGYIESTRSALSITDQLAERMRSRLPSVLDALEALSQVGQGVPTFSMPTVSLDDGLTKEQIRTRNQITGNADKNAQIIASTIESMASVLVSAFAFGGGGRGSGIGGALGGALGLGLGKFAGDQIGGVLGSVVPGIGTILGTVAGSLLGGLFDSHKKSVDSNTSALNRLTSALVNAPSGFKVGYYENQAADPKMLAKLSRTQRQVSSRGGSLGFALAGG